MIAIVALEDDEEAEGVVDGAAAGVVDAADGVVAAGVEAALPPVAEVAADGDVEEAPLGVAALEAGLAPDDVADEEPA